LNSVPPPSMSFTYTRMASILLILALLPYGLWAEDECQSSWQSQRKKKLPKHLQEAIKRREKMQSVRASNEKKQLGLNHGKNIFPHTSTVLQYLQSLNSDLDHSKDRYTPILVKSLHEQNQFLLKSDRASLGDQAAMAVLLMEIFGSFIETRSGTFLADVKKDTESIMLEQNFNIDLYFRFADRLHRGGNILDQKFVDSANELRDELKTFSLLTRICG
jgi:hypothetical protein